MGFLLHLQLIILYYFLPMSTNRKEDTSPATKADIAAIIESMDRRFATMEAQLDNRFEAVDRRFDTVDQQFQRMLEYIRAEGKESRLHGDKLAEETQRHVDAVNKNLQDYVAGMFTQKTYLFGEKFREHDRRIRTLERGEQPAIVS